MMTRPSVSARTEWRVLLGTIATIPGRTICVTSSTNISSSPAMTIAKIVPEPLARVDSLSVVGQAPDRDTALTFLHDVAPDVIMLDMSTLRVPHWRAHSAAWHRAFRSWLWGLARKKSSRALGGHRRALTDLVAAMNGVINGELPCSPRVAGTLVRRLAALAAEQAPELETVLTGRDCQIGGLLEQRHSNKEIAGRLGIEVATVKNHVHNLLEKLNVHRRAAAAPHPLGTTAGRVTASAASPTMTTDLAAPRRDSIG